MRDDVRDAAVRKTAFDWLEMQCALHEGTLPRSLLSAGFQFEGRRVPLVGPQGIFKPAVCPELPLTITTSPSGGPYSDSFADDHRLLYSYRGTNPMHWQNVGLRKAMKRRVPLIYLFGLVPGRYLPIWPVFIVADNPNALSFTVMADDRGAMADALMGGMESVLSDERDEPRRQYITALVQRRLHQASFRERVLKAYNERCALCHLGHRELLDASHILPDSDPRGEPVVSNGLALCKIHHTAFDRHFLGIRPDSVIEIRQDLLEEVDGPMLQHGLKNLHGARLSLPRNPAHRPNRDALSTRYEQFLGAHR
jgi:putative restriction endonuclease